MVHIYLDLCLIIEQFTKIFQERNGAEQDESRDRAQKLDRSQS